MPRRSSRRADEPALLNPYRRPASVPPAPDASAEANDDAGWRLALAVAWLVDLWRATSALQEHETPWAEVAIAGLLVVLTGMTLFWRRAGTLAP
jgi:hypothetical protein